MCNFGHYTINKGMKTDRRRIIAAAMTLLVLGSFGQICAKKHWVATWATAEQVAETHNNPPVPLAGNSIRQIVQTSISGDKLRVKLSNEFGKEPVEIKAAEIAVALTSGNSHLIDEQTNTALTFEGSASIVIQPGELVVSDPVMLSMTNRQNMAITLHFGACPANIITSHPGSRTDSYIAEGNTSDFSKSTATAHWYIINAIEVERKDNARAVVILGNSITDGRGSTTNVQNRWTDILSRRLLAGKGTGNVSVLNMGLGGNCILQGGLGPTAQTRYPRDLFGQEGVKYIVLFEGVNDLGGFGDAVAKADRIIEVYKKIIEEAHSRGIKVYGGTVMPFKGNNYYSDNHEEGRNRLNEWIRTTDLLDGVIDHAAAMADSNDPARMDPAFLFENDWLHPNAEGHRHMGEDVDLSLFTR